MIIKIKCPNCNDELKLNIQDNKVISIEISNQKFSNQDIVSQLLKNNNIEIG